MVRVKNNIKAEYAHEILHLEFIDKNTELNFLCCVDVKDAIQRLIDENNPKYLIIDMNRVKSFESSGAGLIITLINLIPNKKTYFYGFNTECKNRLKLLNMHTFLKSGESLDEVIDFIFGERKNNEKENSRIFR